MSGGVNTDTASLEEVLRAVTSFARETGTFYRGTGLVLDHFEDEARQYRQGLADLLDDRPEGGQSTGDDELDQMMYDYERQDRREQAAIEERIAELDRLVADYADRKDNLASCLKALVMGGNLEDEARGLRHLHDMLQDYLES